MCPTEVYYDFASLISFATNPPMLKEATASLQLTAAVHQKQKRIFVWVAQTSRLLPALMTQSTENEAHYSRGKMKSKPIKIHCMQ